MKKIFTLIAVAAMAISANAQEKYIIQKDFVPSKGQVVEATTSTTITFSDDPGWKASNPADGGFVNQKDYIAGVTGTQNPKDGGYDSGASAGSAYKPASKNLPNAGVYYKVKASQAGAFELALKVGGGKNFYICNADDGSALANTDIKGVAEGGDAGDERRGTRDELRREDLHSHCKEPFGRKQIRQVGHAQRRATGRLHHPPRGYPEWRRAGVRDEKLVSRMAS